MLLKIIVTVDIIIFMRMSTKMRFCHIGGTYCRERMGEVFSEEVLKTKDEGLLRLALGGIIIALCKYVHHLGCIKSVCETFLKEERTVHRSSL